MLNVDDQQLGFRHEAEQEAATEYRSLNRWALAGAGLGFVSWLALVSPLLWLVPILAVVFGFVAIRQIASSPNLWTGQFPAVAGILLAGFFVSWAAVQQLSRQRLLTERAHVHADQVLELIRQGELEQVYQLSLPKANRPISADRAETFRQDPEQRGQFESFFALPPISEMIEAGDKAEYRFEQSRIRGEHATSEDIEVIYEFTTRTASSSERIIVVLRREYQPSERESNWRLIRITVPK